MLPSNELASLTLGNHPVLRQLKLAGNTLPTLALPNSLPTLRVLDVENNALLELDLAKTPALTELNINGNGFSTLDVSSLTKLEKLYAKGNFLLSLNLSHNDWLKTVDLSSNLLSTLDISRNTDITSLDVSSNKLSRIDVSRLTRLQSLSVSKNENITHLNLSRNSYLHTLRADTTSISGLDLSATLRITRVYIRHTRLDACALTSLFTTLPDLSQNPTGYTNIFLSMTSWRGADFSELTERAWKFDLDKDADFGTPESCASAQISLEVSEGGEAALFYGTDELTTLPSTHKVGTVINVKATPAEGYELQGIFMEVPGDNGGLIQLPLTDLGLTLTSDTKVIVRFRPVESRTISLTSKLPVGSDFELSLRQTVDSDRDNVLIDWGNGVWVEEQVTKNQTTISVIDGKLAGSTVRVRGALNRLVASEQHLTSVGLSGMPDLTYVDLYGNELTDIDLSALTKLGILNLAFNELSSINLSHNTALRSLTIRGNSDIASLDLSANKALVEIDAKNLSLTSLALDLPLLEELDVQGNKLTELSLEKIPNLVVLRIVSNKFKTFAPSIRMSELKLLVASRNGLTYADLSRMPMIEQVYLEQNPLTEIKMSNDMISLNFLDISDCGLSACVLDKIYKDLPYWAESTVGATFSVALSNRGQTATANEASKSKTSIATAKGWTVAADGDGTGCTNPASDLLGVGSGFNFYSDGADLVLVLAPEYADSTVRLIDLSGQTVSVGQSSEQYRVSLAHGSYIVSIDGRSFKIRH